MIRNHSQKSRFYPGFFLDIVQKLYIFYPCRAFLGDPKGRVVQILDPHSIWVKKFIFLLQVFQIYNVLNFSNFTNVKKIFEMEISVYFFCILQVHFNYKSNLQSLYPTTNQILNPRGQIEYAYKQNQTKNWTRFNRNAKLFYRKINKSVKIEYVIK